MPILKILTLINYKVSLLVQQCYCSFSFLPPRRRKREKEKNQRGYNYKYKSHILYSLLFNQNIRINQVKGLLNVQQVIMRITRTYFVLSSNTYLLSMQILGIFSFIHRNNNLHIYLSIHLIIYLYKLPNTRISIGIAGYLGGEHTIL